MIGTERIAQTIRAKEYCSTGLFCRPNVLDVPCGPSGGPELLALLYADEKHMGYWYAYIRPYPSRSSGRFVTLVVWMSVDDVTAHPFWIRH